MDLEKPDYRTVSAAIYCRLSKDDEQAGESISIETHDVICKGRIYPSNTS